MKQKIPSVAELIRKHSKARVIKATPVYPVARQLGQSREITRSDVVEQLVRQYG